MRERAGADGAPPSGGSESVATRKSVGGERGTVAERAQKTRRLVTSSESHPDVMIVGESRRAFDICYHQWQTELLKNMA